MWRGRRGWRRRRTWRARWRRLATCEVVVRGGVAACELAACEVVVRGDVAACELAACEVVVRGHVRRGGVRRYARVHRA